jgi:SNF2 family DNA or RNA helicase
MRKLQAIIKAILLRRTKKSLIDGKPIINLPGKTEEIQHVVFNEDEQAYYKALESKTQIQFNRYLRAGTVGKNYSNILVLLLRLRQACCHPHLIMDFEEAPIGADMDPDTMITLAKSLSPDVVSRLLEIEAFEVCPTVRMVNLRANIEKCPVCYDVAENPRIIVPCGHDTCSECLTKISDQAVQQHVAEGNNGVATCKCPTCRGDLKMDSIIDFTTFKKVYKPDQAATANGQIGNETESESDDSEAEDETDSEDEIDSSGDLRGFIVPDDRETEDDMETEDEIQDDDDGARPPSKTSKNKSKSKKEKRRRIKGKGKKKEKSAHVTLAMLKKQASQSAEYRRQYMRYLRKNWEPSAKIDKCVELLEQFQNDGQKTIIFSQFVTLLDLIQVPLDQKKWKPLRYDGSMSADRRNEAINTFTDKADHNIMLISLKAGNAGLNLVAASRVIILDPFWNPFIEMQAIDRAYRIGQQNPVEVHRILIEGTVEDRIIELQERKRRLVESALDEGANKDIGRLDVRQLAYLFGVGMGN